MPYFQIKQSIDITNMTGWISHEYASCSFAFPGIVFFVVMTHISPKLLILLIPLTFFKHQSMVTFFSPCLAVYLHKTLLLMHTPSLSRFRTSSSIPELLNIAQIRTYKIWNFVPSFHFYVTFPVHYIQT